MIGSCSFPSILYLIYLSSKALIFFLYTLGVLWGFSGFGVGKGLIFWFSFCLDVGLGEDDNAKILYDYFLDILLQLLTFLNFERSLTLALSNFQSLSFICQILLNKTVNVFWFSFQKVIALKIILALKFLLSGSNSGVEVYY